MSTDEYPFPVQTQAKFASLLAVTAMGAYLLLIVGATTTLSEAATSCQTWPACDGVGGVFSDAQLAIAVGHRVAAVIVGLLVAMSAIAALWGSASRRVIASLVVALTLYPIQVGVGAVAALGGGASPVVSAVHLALGIVIFGATVLALAWALESATSEQDDPIQAVQEEPSDGAPALDDPTDAPASPARPTSTFERMKLTALAYLRMTKPRLMWLLCLVAAAGMALAAGPDLSSRTVGLTLLGGVLAIGASGTFNNVLERDVDQRMQRTADRPLAVDLVPVRNAIAFGLALTVASLAAFLAINRLAAALGLAAILFYSVVYTLVLKPNTVQNTVIGGAAGALPALIGWAAVTNEIGLPALALAGVIFLWTPAHFYNLAMAYKEDYERGGFPMLPVVHGEAVARKHVVLYLGATLVGAAVLSTVSTLGLLYSLTSVLVGGIFLWAAVRLHWERTDAAALRAFHASNAYLGCLLVAVVIDALVI